MDLHCMIIFAAAVWQSIPPGYRPSFWRRRR